MVLGHAEEGNCIGRLAEEFVDKWPYSCFIRNTSRNYSNAVLDTTHCPIPASKADICSALKKIHCLYGNRRLITVFTKSHH